MSGLQGVEDEVEKLDRLIKAAEDWSDQYKKDEETHAGLIKTEAKLERVLREYFRGLSERIEGFIDWIAYDYKLRELHAASTDVEVEVLIEDGPFGHEDEIVIQTVYDPMTSAVALGAQSGEKLYQVNLGFSTTSATVQRVAKEQIAELVGKSLTSDGRFIENPKAAYRIGDKTRQDIRESIRTSLLLGETHPDALSRLQGVIRDPKRAGMIARTESVNAYQRGLLLMGQQSGAVAKVWLSVNRNDICGTNGKAGMVLITDAFPSGHMAPSAHPNCRCGMRLVYEEEFRRAHPFQAMTMDQGGFIGDGPPSNKSISTGRDYGPAGKSSDPFEVFHGKGHNVDSPQTDLLGNSFYVSRTKDTAKKYGSVSKLDLPFGNNQILKISNDEQYSRFIGDSIRFASASGGNLDYTYAIPRYANHLGFKAVEIAEKVAPDSGIAVTDPTAIAGLVKQLNK